MLACGTFGPMKSSGRLCHYILTESYEMVRAGCFVGTIKELKQRAKAEGKDDYVMWCKFLKKLKNQAAEGT